MRLQQVQQLRLEVNLVVNELKRLSTFLRASELEPHDTFGGYIQRILKGWIFLVFVLVSFA